VAQFRRLEIFQRTLLARGGDARTSRRTARSAALEARNSSDRFTSASQTSRRSRGESLRSSWMNPSTSSPSSRRRRNSFTGLESADFIRCCPDKCTVKATCPEHILREIRGLQSPGLALRSATHLGLGFDRSYAKVATFVSGQYKRSFLRVPPATLLRRPRRSRTLCRGRRARTAKRARPDGRKSPLRCHRNYSMDFGPLVDLHVPASQLLHARFVRRRRNKDSVCVVGARLPVVL
jgi:hypothetical protein